MINLIPRTSASLIAVVLFSAIACKKISRDLVPITAVKDTVAVKSVAITKKAAATPIKTKYVIIVIVDGPRYSETWGDTTHKYIPKRYSLLPEGVLLTNFKNNGITLTDPGHTAICTGNYEDIENGGKELPTYPSIFQSFIKTSGQPANKAWLVTSKDKLQILANCRIDGWAGKYLASTDCGNNGIFTGYRSDDTTYVHTGNVMKTYHPNLMLINLKDVDSFGHGSYWYGYLNALQTTDSQVKGIYDMIQSDPLYKDKTTLIVTNDHGRHLNGIADGFVSHGCDCDGCRHIEFFAIGPDFKKGAIINTAYEQIDISQTVAKLLNFKMEYSKGKVMTELFK